MRKILFSFYQCKVVYYTITEELDLELKRKMKAGTEEEYSFIDLEDRRLTSKLIQ
jgi:hypothetical protein